MLSEIISNKFDITSIKKVYLIPSKNIASEKIKYLNDNFSYLSHMISFSSS